MTMFDINLFCVLFLLNVTTNWIFAQDIIDTITNADLLVETSQGVMQGKRSSTASGFQYKSFLGIPYIKPPLGDLRFRNPEEPDIWSGVFNATDAGLPCIQYTQGGDLLGVEDCVHLNVFVPANSSNLLPTLYPVMAVIHGGGFILGSSDPNLIYGPEKLVEQNVIIVSFNYRLGALGFLCFHTEDVPGNSGLKDQAMALKWVFNNIRSFGGDPNQITVVGDSAGAGSVSYQLLSPSSTGYYQKAIIQSGSSMCPWALEKDPISVGFNLATLLGLTNNDTEEAIDLLKNASASDIVKASSSPVFRGHVNLFFSPVVERIYSNQQSFITTPPSELMRSGRFTRVPTIVGVTPNDGYLYTLPYLEIGNNNEEIASGNVPDLSEFVPDSVRSQNESENRAIEERIKNFYFDSNNNSLRDNYLDLLTDYTFVKDTFRMSNLFATYSPPSYFYLFSYYGSLNADKLANLNINGAVHGDELGYLYNVSLGGINQIPLNDQDIFVTNAIVKLWTDFAKYGDPTPDGMTDLTNWEMLNPDEANWYNITSDLSMITSPFVERLAFWDELEMYN